MKEDVDYFHVYCLVGLVLGSAALMRVVEGNDFPFPSCFRKHPLAKGLFTVQRLSLACKDNNRRGKRRGQGLCVFFT